MNNFNRFKIAQYIALGATLLSVAGIAINVGLHSNIGLMLVTVGFIVGLVSYFFGGLLTAIKMAGGIAKWGWFIAPFPVDILTFFMSFLVAILVFIFFPIIPVRKAYKEQALY